MTTSISPPSTSPVATGPIALAGAPRPAGAPKPKPRKRVNTAEKRHQHNAIERQRRETLNSKFLVLARLLPSLASCRRPSKSAIVNGSISHLSHQRSQRLLASKLLRQLAAERDELFKEVNEWRSANGFQPKVGSASAWTDEMEEVCGVEKETFGNFASVGEGADQDGDDDDEQANSEAMFDLEKANMVAGSFSSSGLITPRSSTDMAMGNGDSFFASIAKSTATATATPPVSIAINGQLNWGTMPQVPFNAFMSDSTDASSTSSPVGSSHQSAILTPPSMETGFAHTPSPHSSGSADDNAPNSSAWMAQQYLFHQAQAPFQQPMASRQAALAAFAAQQQQSSLGNMFLANTQQQSQAGLAQLMASMFPQQQQQQGNTDAKLNLGFGLPNWNEQTVGV